MSERTTPETEILYNRLLTENPGNLIYLEEMLELARRLERERDEARELAHRFRSLYYTQIGIGSSASWFPWEKSK
jgi:hypothetical protein